MKFFLLAITVAVQLPSSVEGVSRRLRATAMVEGTPAIQSGEEIKAKWGKMDEFLKIMFQMACKWKHEKDVQGEANEQFTKGDVTRDELAGLKKDIRAQNVEDMSQACGRITASFKAKCRTGCGDRWGDAAVKRNECDGKCVSVYDKFEKTCNEQSGNLEKVYEMEEKDAGARKQCHEGFCASFPTVWMQSDKASMATERDTRCTEKCTAASIEVGCKRKWQLQADMISAQVASACFEQGTAKACFDEKQGVASTAQETCSTGGKAGCETQNAACLADGKADASHPDAAGFCTERKKMCESQVVEGCLAKHKSALEAAQKECEGADATALKTCKQETMGAKELAASDTCIAEDTPACSKDCTAKCDVDKMDGCLVNLKSDFDATTEFCGELWTLLHKSSEVDPVTGDPIVLIAAGNTSTTANTTKK